MNQKEQLLSTTNNEEDEKWRKIIEEWRQSGLSILEWCRNREDLSYSTFMTHRKRLFPEEIRKSEFTEQPTTWSKLSMELSSSSIDVFVNDCQIVVTSGFDQDLLREVVEVLKNAH